MFFLDLLSAEICFIIVLSPPRAGRYKGRSRLGLAVLWKFSFVTKKVAPLQSSRTLLCLSIHLNGERDDCTDNAGPDWPFRRKGTRVGDEAVPEYGHAGQSGLHAHEHAPIGVGVHRLRLPSQ